MLDAIYYPVESHIYSFAPLLFDGIVGDTRRILVASDNGSWRLWMTEANECCTDVSGFAGAEEEFTKFGFAGRSHEIFEDGTEYVDGSVWWWERSAER